MHKRLGKILLGIAGIGVLVAATQGYDRLRDKVLIGQGTASDKTIVFDTGNGSNNAVITGDSSGNIISTIKSGDIFKVTGGPFRADNGSASLPSYSFIPSNNTGMHSTGSGVLNLSAGGVDVANFTTSNVNLSGSSQLLVADGSVSSPSYSFDTNTTTGLYKSANGHVDVATNGTLAVDIATTTIDISNRLLFVKDGDAGSPGIGFQSNQTTGIYKSASNHLSVTVGGTQALDVSAAQVAVKNTGLTVDGSATISGTGGNTPHGCVNRISGAGSTTKSCNAGEIATGGGCNSGNTSFFITTNRGTPATDATQVTGWQCTAADSGGTPQNGSMITSAICCAI